MPESARKALSDCVRVDRRGSISIITINRPEKRNAVDLETSIALNAAFASFEADATARVAILTGAGGVFCAGADLGAIADGRLREIIDAEPGGFGGLVRLLRRKVVIAAVNGHAIAGGFELVLAADLAVAVSTAEFGLPEVTRGIVPGAGGLVRLPRQLPPKVAFEMILTGRRIDAERALRLGLVNEVVDDVAELIPAAIALAELIASEPATAVDAARTVAETAASDTAQAAWKLNDRAWASVLASADSGEGARAFVENRAPRWETPD